MWKKYLDEKNTLYGCRNEFRDASKVSTYPDDITRASKTVIRRVHIHLINYRISPI